MCVTLVLLSLNACSSCTSLFMKWHIWIIEASGKRAEVINTDCVTCALFTTSSVWCLVLVGVDKEYIHLRVWLITVFVFQVQASLLRGHTWHHHLQSHHVRSNKSGQYECRPTEENSSVIIVFFLISTVAISTNQMSVGCAVLGFFQPMKIHYICTTAQVQFHFPPCLIFCCVFTFVKICKQKESKWPSYGVTLKIAMWQMISVPSQFCLCDITRVLCCLQQWPYGDICGIGPVGKGQGTEFNLTFRKGSGKKSETLKFSTEHRTELLTEALVKRLKMHFFTLIIHWASTDLVHLYN